MGTEGIGHEHGDHGEHSHMFETGDSFENCSNEPNDETGTYLITAADEGCSPMNYNNAISFCTGSGLSAVSLDSSRPASEVGEILDLAGIPGNEKFWTSGLIVRLDSWLFHVAYDVSFRLLFLGILWIGLRPRIA